MSNNNVKVHGSVKLVDAPCFLAQYEDGHGKQAVRLGFVIGQEVRFLDDKYLSKPAQTWLMDDILIALGLKDVDSVATPANLETQI